MALGNPNGGTQKVESPFIGFKTFQVQVQTKSSHCFIAKQIFYAQEPVIESFSNVEEYNDALKLYSSCLEEFNKQLAEAQSKRGTPLADEFLKNYSRTESDIREGKNAVYTLKPIEVMELDGHLINMYRKVDKGPTFSTEKVYFTIADFRNKEIYHINSSYSEFMRMSLDMLLNIDSFNRPIQMKMNLVMDPSKEFKEPKLDAKGNKQYNAKILIDFSPERGFYTTMVKPLYHNYSKKLDEHGKQIFEENKPMFIHDCSEADANEYHLGMEAIFEDKNFAKITRFFIKKINNILIPKIQADSKEFFKSIGFLASYEYNDERSIWKMQFKKHSPTLLVEETVAPDDKEDMPF
jgi:hypothetical protein